MEGVRGGEERARTRAGGQSRCCSSQQGVTMVGTRSSTRPLGGCHRGLFHLHLHLLLFFLLSDHGHDPGEEPSLGAGTWGGAGGCQVHRSCRARVNADHTMVQRDPSPGGNGSPRRLCPYQRLQHQKLRGVAHPGEDCSPQQVCRAGCIPHDCIVGNPGVREPFRHGSQDGGVGVHGQDAGRGSTAAAGGETGGHERRQWWAGWERGAQWAASRYSSMQSVYSRPIPRRWSHLAQTPRKISARITASSIVSAVQYRAMPRGGVLNP
jgi:hypothetical protein